MVSTVFIDVATSLFSRGFYSMLLCNHIITQWHDPTRMCMYLSTHIWAIYNQVNTSIELCIYKYHIYMLICIPSVTKEKF